MKQPYVLVLYYSRSGHTKELAQYIARGVGMVHGIEARIRTVPPVSATCEASDKEVPDDGAPYADLEDMRRCSGLALGSPTRFGNMAAPMKYFLDTTAPLWLKGDLINKPACVFTSTSTMHGGQESTLLSMMNPLLHHGMLMMGLPYSEEELNTTQTGGTPYGVSHLAGLSGEHAISEEEQVLAKKMGQRLGQMALTLAGGSECE